MPFWKLNPLFLGLALLAPFNTHAGRCERVFQDPSGNHFSVPVEPLNVRGSFNAIQLSSGIKIPGATLHHIFHGDFRARDLNSSNGPQRVVGLDGGLHTREALSQFLEMRPEIDRLLENNPTLIEKIQTGYCRFTSPKRHFQAVRIWLSIMSQDETEK